MNYKDLIGKSASEILLILNVVEPPINAISIADILGFRVFSAILEKTEFGNNDSWFDKYNRRIYIDKSCSNHNFAVAIELGKILSEEPFKFAAELLMPPAMILAYYPRSNPIETLATMFNVPEKSIKIRLKTMGIQI
jgi:hypothetical protein